MHFRQRRTATVGPDLSHRRTMVNEVLRAPAVRKAIQAEAGDDPRKQEASREKARAYAEKYVGMATERFSLAPNRLKSILPLRWPSRH